MWLNTCKSERFTFFHVVAGANVSSQGLDVRGLGKDLCPLVLSRYANRYVFDVNHSVYRRVTVGVVLVRGPAVVGLSSFIASSSSSSSVALHRGGRRPRDTATSMSAGMTWKGRVSRIASSIFSWLYGEKLLVCIVLEMGSSIIWAKNLIDENRRYSESNNIAYSQAYKSSLDILAWRTT